MYINVKKIMQNGIHTPVLTNVKLVSQAETADFHQRQGCGWGFEDKGFVLAALFIGRRDTDI